MYRRAQVLEKNVVYLGNRILCSKSIRGYCEHGGKDSEGRGEFTDKGT